MLLGPALAPPLLCTLAIVIPSSLHLFLHWTIIPLYLNLSYLLSFCLSLYFLATLLFTEPGIIPRATLKYHYTDDDQC